MGKAGDGGAVVLAGTGIGGQTAGLTGIARRRKMLGQLGSIAQPKVQPLSGHGVHGLGGIAHQHHAPADQLGRIFKPEWHGSPFAHGGYLADALAAPRMSQRNGDTTLVETLLKFPGSAQATALEAKGHKWRETDQIGAANGIRFNTDGTVTAVSEPLRHGGGSAITQKQ